MSDIHEMGAVDWFLIEAENKQINGALIPPLLDKRLRDQGILTDEEFAAQKARILAR